MNPLDITLPNLPYNAIISLVISVVIGFAYSFFRGASLGRLIFSVVASVAGFYLGQYLAGVFQWSFVMWNGVHLIEGILGSLLAVWVVNS
jgi:uncharacterized membrane protein YeaQ/YmgE (transglycosylase-associated protein family)